MRRPTQTLQRPGRELPFNLVERVGFGEHPIVETGSRDVVSKQRANIAFALPVDEPFFGLKASQDAVHPARVTLGDLKFPRAQIQQRQPHGFGGPMNGRNVVVGLAFKHVVVHHQPGGHQLCDAPLDQSFGLFGVFELVAYGHLQSRLDELGEVGVQAVVWKSSQFHFRGTLPLPRLVKTMFNTLAAATASAPNVS